MKKIITAVLTAMVAMIITGCSSTHIQKDYHSRGQIGTHDDASRADSRHVLGFVSERQQTSIATTNNLGESVVDGTLTVHKAFNPFNVVAGLIHVDIHCWTTAEPFVRPVYGQPIGARYGY